MKSKQSSELFATMTEALSKAYDDISTLALRNARTTPRISQFYDVGSTYGVGNDVA